MFKTENNELFSSTVITIGYLMGAIFLPLVNICYLVVKLMGKNRLAAIPRWIVIANIIFFILLIYYIFYLNDPYYHQK